MRWKSAPEAMIRGAAVVHGDRAFFCPSESNKVYSYQIIPRKEQWSQLPDNANEVFGLAVNDGLCGSGPTNTLLSLTGVGDRKQ